LRLQKELDSIEFYIEQGYQDLAAKSLEDLEAEFGAQAGIVSLRARMGTPSVASVVKSASEKPVAVENFHAPEKTEVVENLYTPEKEAVVENDFVPQAPIAEKTESEKGSDMLDELKNEFSLEEDAAANTEEDYETHYHLATAYKDIGLTENAIREFQDAINLVGPDDGTRRFFQCANLLGHCFMEKFMPKAATKWFMRALEVADLNEDEKHAIYYELGGAFEADDDREKAIGYFERLYSEDVSYRNVSERLQELQDNNLQS